MKQTIRGARDGVTVEEFQEGLEYEFGDAPRDADLGRVFLREGWAEELRALPEAPENASLGPAPENKAAAPKRRRG